jgi:anti-sigma regulatory factor (Ser/Thr protein kinase)
MRFTETFEPEAVTVGAARRFVIAALESGGLPLGDVPLLVSELASNAVLHARSAFTVTIRADDRRVRVEVTDGNSRLPVLAAAPITALSGRGLALLQALASSWGVEPRSESGKTVWFEVTFPRLVSLPR